jgi:hypothetical protein
VYAGDKGERESGSGKVGDGYDSGFDAEAEGKVFGAWDE